MHVQVVFKSPVRSSLLTLRAFNRDCNRSTSVLAPQKTGLDRLGLVYIGFFGPRTGPGPNWSSAETYIYMYQKWLFS